METQVTQVTEPKEIKKEKRPTMIQIPTGDFRNMPIPGFDSAKLGVCFVRVVDLPEVLGKFMEVNPRLPSRTMKGALSGQVVKGILQTLRDLPDEMSIKNQGIYLLAKTVEFGKDSKGKGIIRLIMIDPAKHGIVNGGHTYAAIREAVESATEEERAGLEKAYVQLHIYQGVPKGFVAEMAEGLNRNKQVDDLSLTNLQGEFDYIRQVLRDKGKEDVVAYHQGDAGEIYISEILVYLELFNKYRMDNGGRPYSLYNKQSLGLKYFKEDISQQHMKELVEKLPDILWLADSIREATPLAAKRNKFKFGMANIGGSKAGSASNRGVLLPYLGTKMDYRVPNGWVYPMLAAFRANLKIKKNGEMDWIMPLAKLLPEVISDLVAIIVREHKAHNSRPEEVGKHDSAYTQCHSKIELYLAKKGL